MSAYGSDACRESPIGRTCHRKGLPAGVYLGQDYEYQPYSFDAISRIKNPFPLPLVV